MSEIVEVEITNSTAEALMELKEEYGELTIQGDLENAITSSIREGYRQLGESEGEVRPGDMMGPE